MPILNKIVETCLYVGDLDKTQDFYHGLLGLPLITLKKGRHVFFKVGKDVLLCFLSQATREEASLPHHYAEGHQHFAFECAANEYPVWKEHLTASGITIEQEVDWGRGIHSIYFRDPDMHCVEITMPGLWEK